ncbi:TPA: LOW QUALITY PROTEIN: hypothetical protein N0F65_010700 [Lagenidium giganteum]|uniref:RING-type E3 ubiquitin transferase n=1 Tax=Lagenidium giganteum TaxID=4803 RepID=A0AAV2ZBM4_9STRA|nr:TPA: LOW QUALITY PROTEIN: hypothetical protein N0F65_010700 [Lagenidium giganteum]
MGECGKMAGSNAVAKDTAESGVATQAESTPALPVVVTLPIEYQCPLCFDVLRQPVKLPLTCFERALELTSVNCGFCRKRIVGLARKKQTRVDEVLWALIQSRCPAVSEADQELQIEFEDAAASQASIAEKEVAWASTNASAAATAMYQPGELRAFYEDKVAALRSERADAEAQALEQTMKFLLTDPEYLASIHKGSKAAPGVAVDHIEVVPATSSPLPALTVNTSVPLRRLPHSDRDGRSSSKGKKKAGSATGSQQRLDAFLAPRTRRSRKMLGRPLSAQLATRPTVGNTFSSHSPKRRKALFQLTLLETQTSTPTTSNQQRRQQVQSSSPTRTNKTLVRVRTVKSLTSSTAKAHAAASKRAATTPASRRPWKCPHCTFENTCFDSRCSMCLAVPSAS